LTDQNLLIYFTTLMPFTYGMRYPLDDGYVFVIQTSNNKSAHDACYEHIRVFLWIQSVVMQIKPVAKNPQQLKVDTEVSLKIK